MSVRLRAIEALGRRALPASRAALRELAASMPEPRIRAAAVRSLGRIAPLSELDRAALERVTAEDPEPSVRELAVTILTRARRG